MKSPVRSFTLPAAVGFFIVVVALGIATRGMGQERQNGNTENKESRRFWRAHATIRGADGSGIFGHVTLTQEPGDSHNPVPLVEIFALVDGLPPGDHGFHIHEVGKCTNNFADAGGHFDPGPFSNSTPADANHPFHMGDLSNLEANQRGNAFLLYATSRVSLSPGPLSLFDADGSAIVVHANPDTGQTGVNGAAGGARIACGVIELD
jgi:Cu-Zn family superoxide dismutase